MANAKYEKQLAKEAARQAKRKAKINAIYAKAAEVRKENPAKAAKIQARGDKLKAKIADTAGDRIFNIITSILLILVTIIVGYPCLYVVSCSFSSTVALQSGQVVLWPVDATTAAYDFVFAFRQVWVGYRNSIFYTVMGVLFTMAATILVAYPLSKRTYQGRNKFMLFFYLCTLFAAGMIPEFLVKTSLGLFDNIWAVLLQGTVAVSHIIILRTAFQSSIPGDLFDAAKIDGANDFQSLFKIALPLAKATLSVLVLYVIVGAWNEYFTSMLYLRDPEMFPLQLVLRPIMTSISGTMGLDNTGGTAGEAMEGLQGVRYALIVISTVPPLLAYFFVQKAFKSGVMVGSLKG